MSDQQNPLPSTFHSSTEFSIDGKWVTEEQWMARAKNLTLRWWPLPRVALAPKTYCRVNVEHVENPYSKKIVTVHKIVIEEAPEGYQALWMTQDPSTGQRVLVSETSHKSSSWFALDVVNTPSPPPPPLPHMMRYVPLSYDPRSGGQC